MDRKYRELKRAADMGDALAKHKLLAEMLRRGEVKPVDPNRVKMKKAEIARLNKRWESRERLGPERRMTPEMRRIKRQRKKSAKRQKSSRLQHRMRMEFLW